MVRARVAECSAVNRGVLLEADVRELRRPRHDQRAQCVPLQSAAGGQCRSWTGRSIN